MKFMGIVAEHHHQLASLGIINIKINFITMTKGCTMYQPTVSLNLIKFLGIIIVQGVCVCVCVCMCVCVYAGSSHMLKLANQI